MDKKVTEILSRDHGIQAIPGKKVTCPFCGHKTFSIKRDDSLGKCFRPDCNKHISTKRKKGGGVSPGKSHATVQPGEGCTLEQYTESKKIPIAFLKKLGLTQITYLGKPAVRIPYYDQEGKETAVKFRIALHKSKEADNRFRWKSGSKLIPYGLWRLDEAKKMGYLNVDEGMSDPQTMWLHGFPALGLPGARCWKHEWEYIFDGIPKIFINVENDSGGEAVKKWIGASNFKKRVCF